MALRLGSSTSGQMWANYEAGRIPQHRTVQAIVEKFGFPLLWLYDGNEGQLNTEQFRVIALGEARIEENWRPGRRR